MDAAARPSTNSAAMRESNLSSILRHLRENAPTSRSALAEMTGLNKATVSRLVEDLIRLGLIREVGEGLSDGRGRKAVLLDINPDGGVIVSAEIGVDFILVICADFSSQILWRRQESTASLGSREAVIERGLQLLRRAIAFGNSRFSKFLGLAVGVPGLVDSSDGTLLFAPNLGWRDVPLGRILREHFQYRIFVDNEANLAALGEYYFGAAQRYDQVLYISAGIGVGGGLVNHGRLVTGTAGFAGEFGHMTMDPRGRLCGCGNRGCWETQAGQAALFRRIRESLAKKTPSILNEMTGGNLNDLSVALVIEAAQKRDEVAIEAFRTVGRALGIGIASLVNALNPDLVVFGGTLSPAGPFIFPSLKQEVHRRALPWTGGVANLVCAKNGADNCVLGGVAKVCECIIHQPVQSLQEPVLN
jgi:glucokinase-like ROK family protein